MRHLLLSLFAAVLLLAACSPQPEYARFSGDTYYVGTNFWYGAILASEGQSVIDIQVKKNNCHCQSRHVWHVF